MQPPTDAEAVILGVLLTTSRAMNGRELVRASGGNVSRAGVYVLLGRLEDKGLVTSKPAGSGRRVYVATKRCRKIMAARDAYLKALSE